MAFNLVQAMRKLTDQGKTIVFTIHQPSSEIFFLFDKYKKKNFGIYFIILKYVFFIDYIY